jgi:hypothetical protein
MVIIDLRISAIRLADMAYGYSHPLPFSVNQNARSSVLSDILSQVEGILQKVKGKGWAMPRQNRVTPFGDILTTPARGTVMGNRGVLHDDQGNIKRRWQLKRWLVCVLEFRGRKRTVMTPGHYTELFFLDEATALAAGHRPCAECRHARFLAFCNAWASANPADGGSSRPTAPVIDDRLHAERLGSGRSKPSFLGKLDELPDGVFVTVPAWGEQAYLVWGRHLLAWSPGGYRERRRRPRQAKVKVLTPPSTVGTIQAGYVPDVHPTAGTIA